MTEEILIDLKIPGAEDKIDAITKELVELNEEQKKLVATNKELEKSGNANSKQYLDNARQIEINKQKIQENTASRKGLVQAMVAEDGSIKALRASNAELIKQRDIITTKTETGRAKIQEINKQIDINNDKIRENVSALEKQKINIGNYASALDGVMPGLGSFANGISSLFNPVTALATGVGALAKAYFSTGRGAQDLENIQFRLQATTEVLSNKVADLVDKFKDPDSTIGKFSKALVDSNPLIQSLRFQWNLFFGETQEEIDKLSDLKGILDDIDQQLTGAVTKRNNLLEDNSELIANINESETTYEQKLESLQKAEKNINEAYKESVGLKKLQVELLKQELETNKDSEAILRQIDTINKDISQEQRQQGKQLAIIEKLTDNIETKERERLNTIIEQNAAKVADAEFQKLQAEIKEQDKLNEIGDPKTSEDERLKATLAGIQEEIEAETSLTKAKKESANATKASVTGDKNRIQSIISLTASVLGLADSESKAGRGLAIATIATNAAIGVSNAVKAGSGLVWPANIGAILSGITAVLVGIGQAKSFLGNKAAGGGNFVTKGPTMLLVGDNPGGVEHISVTPISGKGSTRVVEGSGLTQVAMAGGGNLTAIGSNETRIAASNSKGQFDPKQVASLMDMVKIVLVRESYEAAQMQENERVALTKVV